MMTVIVRELIESDRKHWEALFRGYLKFYKATLAKETIETTWQRLLENDKQFHIGLVAVSNGDQPIGLAHLLFHRST